MVVGLSKCFPTYEDTIPTDAAQTNHCLTPSLCRSGLPEEQTSCKILFMLGGNYFYTPVWFSQPDSKTPEVRDLVDNP